MTANIMDKVRKLAALAERAGTVHEAMVAEAKLHELLLRHNLSMSSIHQPTIHDYSKTQYNIRGQQGWRRHLIDVIAKHHGGTSIYTTGSSTVDIVAPKESIDGITFLFDRLLVELQRLHREAWKVAPKIEKVKYVNRFTYEETYREHEVKKSSWSTAFYTGAVSKLHDILKAQRDEVRDDVQREGLVPYNTDALLREAIEELVGQTKQGRRRRVHAGGWNAGQTAANSVNFNQHVGGQTLAITGK